MSPKVTYGLPEGYPRVTQGLPRIAKGHKCQPGLVWLSSYFESILALELKNRFFVQILFEFLILKLNIPSISKNM